MDSSRRTRREPTPGEFHDPISDYSAPVYADELEQSLMENGVSATIPSQPYNAVTGDTTVADVVRLLAENVQRCVVIIDEDRKPVGIFSERDVLNRVAENYAEIAYKPIREFMTPNPVVVFDTGKPARVLNLMSEGMFRHLPLVDVDGKLVGVIGARGLIDYLQQFFAELPLD